MKKYFLILLITTISCDDIGFDEEIEEPKREDRYENQTPDWWFDTLTYNMELEIHLVQQEIDPKLDRVILARDLRRATNNFLNLDFTRYPDSLAWDVVNNIRKSRFIYINNLNGYNIPLDSLNSINVLQIENSYIPNLTLNNIKHDNFRTLTLSNSIVDTMNIKNEELSKLIFYGRDSLYNKTEIKYSEIPNLQQLQLGFINIDSINLCNNYLLEYFSVYQGNINSLYLQDRIDTTNIKLNNNYKIIKCK